MQSILQAAALNQASILKLKFSDASSDTALQLSEGQIIGVRSSMLPDWSTSLIQHGLHPATVASASLTSTSYIDALSTLIDTGHLTTDDIADITRSRTLAALLPIVWRDAVSETSLYDGRIPTRPLGSINAREAVGTAEQHAATLSPVAKQLLPADTFLPLPALPIKLTSVQHNVLRLITQGLNLGEISRRLPLRWDLLTEHILDFRSRNLIYANTSGTTASSRRLHAEQEAPDFTLPAMTGEQVQLSDLKGQPVWLIFNRQSTCAMCNPHHAQIITMSSRLKSLGVQIVSVWGSTPEDLRAGVGKLQPPYPVLADPEDRIYDQYGLTKSLSGTLDARNLPMMMQGFKMMGTSALKSDGELLRMPAEFLIGADGRIQEAHYNSYGTDWLPMERVLAWATSGR